MARDARYPAFLSSLLASNIIVRKVGRNSCSAYESLAAEVIPAATLQSLHWSQPSQEA